jgi:hypothetical protein
MGWLVAAAHVACGGRVADRPQPDPAASADAVSADASTPRPPTSRPDDPDSAAALKSVLESVAQAVAERTDAPLACRFDFPAQGDPRAGAYRLTVDDVAQYGGASDAFVRFVTADIDGGTQTMLVTYIPAVSPSLDVGHDAAGVTYRYDFGGYLDDALTVALGSDADAGMSTVALSFEKSRLGQRIFELRCAPFPLAPLGPARAAP